MSDWKSTKSRWLQKVEQAKAKTPFTRGVQPNMYRGRSGRCASTRASAAPKASNERYRLLLEAGQTGLSVAFDLPTQMGRDSDTRWPLGEVGKVGVPIDSLEDMEVLFDGSRSTRCRPR
jgi:methylmalonyl-CoA mutase N-terminal domain/subunit